MENNPDSSQAVEQTSSLDQERDARLRKIQLEALGTTRRDRITTNDFDDTPTGLQTLDDLERVRRVNQRGTKENAVTDIEKAALSGWNAAYLTLKEEHLLEEGLEDLCAGQTHRERLLSMYPPQRGRSRDQHASQRGNYPAQHRSQLSIDALEEAKKFHREVRGLHSTRGSGRGGRGGSYVGAASTRHPQQRKTTGEAPAPPTQPQAELPRPRAHLPPVTRQLEISKEQSEAPTERQSDNPAIGETTASSIQSTKTEIWESNLTNPKDYISLALARTASVTKGTYTPSASKPKFNAHERASLRAAAAKEKAAAKTESSNLQPASQPEGVQAKTNQPKPQQQFPITPSNNDLLLDTSAAIQPKGQTGDLPLTSYAQDLMDVDFSATGNLSAPIQVSTQDRGDESQPAVTAGTPGLREVDSHLASFQPILQRELAPDVLEHFERLRIHVRQKLEQGDQAITSTVATEDSIAGENVAASQVAKRPASVVSASSTKDLTEGFEKISIDDDKPQAVENLSQYADTNPFGPKPTGKAHQPSSPEDAAHQDSRETAPSVQAFPNTKDPRLAGTRSVSSTVPAVISSGLGEEVSPPRRASVAPFRQPTPFGVQPRFQAPDRYTLSTDRPRPPEFLRKSQPVNPDPRVSPLLQYSQPAPPSSVPRGLPATQPPAPRRYAGLPMGQPAASKDQALEHRVPALPLGGKASQAGTSSEMPRYESGGRPQPFFNMTTGAPQVAGWLKKEKSSDDPAAAARAQYGGYDKEEKNEGEVDDEEDEVEGGAKLGA